MHKRRAVGEYRCFLTRSAIVSPRSLMSKVVYLFRQTMCEHLSKLTVSKIDKFIFNLIFVDFFCVKKQIWRIPSGHSRRYAKKKSLFAGAVFLN